MRLGSVAVGLLTFSCFPFFVIFLSAFVDKIRLRLRDFCLLVVLLLGVNLIVPSAATGSHGWAAPLVGFSSGFFFALIQLINHRLVKHQDPVTISAYQNGIAAIALLPFVHVSMLPSTSRAIIQLLFLGLICTAVAHTMFIAAMRSVSARTASLFSYLEPVYGIGMASLLLGEMPNVRTLAGGAVILFSIFLATRGDLP
jgi:drug/metabolite transporter (DMT)-like permease